MAAVAVSTAEAVGAVAVVEGSTVVDTAAEDIPADIMEVPAARVCAVERG
jgi:hypothetical protein